MRIIPAIDIIDGKCVRLTQGDYNQKKIYNENPLEVAKEFEDHGLQYLHLVDLDGAKQGKLTNAATLESICSKTSLTVDFGGGIKTDEDIEGAFNAGASQITCGSIAVKNPDKVNEWLSKYGKDKLILGADVKGENIAISGWTQETDVTIYDLLADYLEKGFKSVICTDIATDGMLKGPSFELYSKLLSKFDQMQLIASGGVSSYNDLIQLKQIGADGAIIGKAIYEGKVSLNQLKEIADA